MSVKFRLFIAASHCKTETNKGKNIFQNWTAHSSRIHTHSMAEMFLKRWPKLRKWNRPVTLRLEVLYVEVSLGKTVMSKLLLEVKLAPAVQAAQQPSNPAIYGKPN